ncbi:MAG: DMT family transporter, partial [Bacteroidales bacterium]|nr:DMT family transporter [Bacteroidales bacterium]
MEKGKRNSIVLAIIACLLWATAFAGIKIGLKYTTPLHFAGIRFMLSGLLIFPFVPKIRTSFNELKPYFRKIVFISFFQTFGLYALFYLGVARVPAAHSALIIGASPIIINIMAHFAGIQDHFTWRKAISIVIGFSGIVVITLGKFNQISGEEISIVGVLILLASSVSGGMGNILIAKYKLPGIAILKNAIQLFLGGAGIFFISLFIEPFNFGIKPLEYYYSLAWLSALSAIAFSLWFIILQRGDVTVSEINLWKFIIPVFGAVFSWIVLSNEQPNKITIIGIVLVGSSLI